MTDLPEIRDLIVLSRRSRGEDAALRGMPEEIRQKAELGRHVRNQLVLLDDSEAARKPAVTRAAAKSSSMRDMMDQLMLAFAEAVSGERLRRLERDVAALHQRLRDVGVSEEAAEQDKRFDAEIAFLRKSVGQLSPTAEPADFDFDAASEELE